MADLDTLRAEAREAILKRTMFSRGQIARDLGLEHAAPAGERRKGDGKGTPQEVLDVRAARDHENLLIRAELDAINEALVAGEIEFKGQRQFVRVAT